MSATNTIIRIDDPPKYSDLEFRLRADREIKIAGFLIQEWDCGDGKFSTTIDGLKSKLDYDQVIEWFLAKARGE